MLALCASSSARPCIASTPVELQRFDDVAQKGYFLACGFEQCDLPLWAHNFERETGEACTGPDIEQAGLWFGNE